MASPLGQWGAPPPVGVGREGGTEGGEGVASRQVGEGRPDLYLLASRAHPSPLRP
jgi:hypothetical protein